MLVQLGDQCLDYQFGTVKYFSMLLSMGLCMTLVSHFLIAYLPHRSLTIGIFTIILTAIILGIVNTKKNCPQCHEKL